MMEKLKNWKLWAVVIVLLLLIRGCGSCGSDDSSNGKKQEQTSNSSSQNVPGWLTQYKFVCETGDGSATVIKFNNNGTARMRIVDEMGRTISGMDFEGTFSVRDDVVYFIFSADESKTIVFEMDKQRQRLHAEGGGVFKQSVL
jgi:hypothetical protein